MLAKAHLGRLFPTVDILFVKLIATMYLFVCPPTVSRPLSFKVLRLVQMAARSLQSQQKPSVAIRQKKICPLLPVNLGLGLFLNRYTRHEKKECMAQLSWLHNTKDILNRHHISVLHICTPLTTTSEQDKTPWSDIWVKKKSCPHIKSGCKGKSCTKNRFSNWTADVENPPKKTWSEKNAQRKRSLVSWLNNTKDIPNRHLPHCTPLTTTSPHNTSTPYEPSNNLNQQ